VKLLAHALALRADELFERLVRLLPALDLQVNLFARTIQGPASLGEFLRFGAAAIRWKYRR
jgi:hypothetical protein